MERRSLIAMIVIAMATLLIAMILATTRGEESPSEAALPTSDTLIETTSTATGATTDSTVSTTDGSTSTTEPPLVATLPPGGSACDAYRTIDIAGVVAAEDLVEVSGTAASRTQPGVLWAHNDSRGGPRVFAIGPDGADLGGYDIAGALAFDWEDMAAGPGPDAETSSLYLGDIGDNFSIRAGRVTVYRVPEPHPAALDGPIEGAVALEFEYPDGTYNSEAMFVVDGSVYIVTKDQEEARVYRGDATGDGSGVEMLELVTVLRLGAEVSGADVSWDGTTIALRGYGSVWLWRLEPGATVAEALADDACEGPSPNEVQGEAIAFLPDNAYSTISEGRNPDLLVVPFDP